MSAALVTAAATIVVALVGYLATYFTGIATARVASRVTRINSQLSDLYGPLLADLEAGNAAWKAFTDEAGGEGKTFWSEKRVPTESEAALWQEWVTKIFQPRNERMIDRVMTHADLLNEDAMPPCLMRLAANVAVYEVLAARWAQDDFVGRSLKDYVAQPDYQFPRDELDAYLGDNFRTLKVTQQELLSRYSRRLLSLPVKRAHKPDHLPPPRDTATA